MKPYLIFGIAAFLIAGVPAIISLLGNLKEIISEHKQKKNKSH